VNAAYPTDTIVALATPTGQGAIAVLRISGPATADILRKLTATVPAPRYATLCHLRDEAGATIDHGLVLHFPAPRSYTGEDMAELHLHGGHAVVTHALSALHTAGARSAQPGEFSQRAFLNGKLDLLQAEAVADLIAARSRRSAAVALQAMSGRFSQQLGMVVQELVALRGELEASIDFTDEGLDHLDLRLMHQRLVTLRGTIGGFITAAQRGARLASGLQVAIVGRPNSGKSTLFNLLAHEERAIVSAIPGTTRDVLSAEVDVDGLAITLYDTAGLRDGTNDIEREGIRRARLQAAQADLLLWVRDATDPTDDACAPALDADVPCIQVRNKIDLTGESARRSEVDGQVQVALSAVAEQGLELLREAIAQAAGLGGDEGDTPLLARERHLRALQVAHSALALPMLRQVAEAPEEIAEALRQAHCALTEMTGEFTSEDLLGEIFARFCIGK
jgi:tRNA modification GTPase